MADIEINYKNSTIVSINSSGTTTLNTAGTYCEDDIEVVYTKPGSSINLLSKTATPGVSAQTIVADTGYDGLSLVDISGDANLLASNIASGVTIFGVTGTLSGGAGWETAPESWVDALNNRTISETYGSMVLNIKNYAFYSCSNLTTISFPNCTIIGTNAFNYCSKLTTISFPNCTSIGTYAFANCKSLSIANFPKCVLIDTSAFYFCSNLTTISFPNCTIIGTNAFNFCYNLTTISFPNCISIYYGAFSKCSNLTTIFFPECITIGASAFNYCSNLTTISFPNCALINGSAFSNCSKLESIYLLGKKIPALSSTNVFSNTPILNSTYLGYYGSIYVLNNLLNNFKTATNWSLLSERFVGI